jgi:protein TonB
MFESLQSNNHKNALQRLLALVLSVSLHGLILSLIVVLPLLFFRGLSEVDFLTFLIADPMPPPAPPPPIPIPAERALTKAGNQGTALLPITVVPESLPKGIPAPDVEPPSVQVGAGIEGIGPGLSMGAGVAGLGILPGVLGAAPPAPPPPPPPPTRRPPLRVGGSVQESKLIRKVPPAYPDIARRARVSGDVFLEVMLDEEGNVSGVKVLRGHPLLVEEAVRAVKQWKYSPTLLNGEPIPIVAAVTVSFRLN